MNSSISSSEGRDAPAATARHLLWMGVSAIIGFMAIWAYVAAFPTAYRTDAYIHWLVQQQRLVACDLGEVAVFGDSKPQAAIRPRSMNTQVVNLAISGTSPLETYFTIEQALLCPRKPRLVVLSFALNAFVRPAGFWTQDSSENMLTPAARQELEDSAVRLDDTISIGPLPADGLPGFARHWLYSVKFPPISFGRLLHAWGGMRWWHNRELKQQIEQAVGFEQYAQQARTDQMAEDALLSSGHPRPLVDEYFMRTLRMLDTAGVDVVYLPIPVNQATRDGTSPRVSAELTDFLIRAAAAIPRLRIAGDPLLCWPNDMFSDRAHLNFAGAVAFSEDLDKRLRTVLACDPLVPPVSRCPITANAGRPR